MTGPISEEQNLKAWAVYVEVAKKVVAVLEQEGVTQGEALLVISLAKAVLHHQPVKLPDVAAEKVVQSNYYDFYPAKDGVTFPLRDSEQ